MEKPGATAHGYDGEVDAPWKPFSDSLPFICNPKNSAVSYPQLFRRIAFLSRWAPDAARVIFAPWRRAAGAHQHHGQLLHRLVGQIPSNPLRSRAMVTVGAWVYKK